MCPNPNFAQTALVRSQVVTGRLTEQEKTSWLEKMKFLKEKPKDRQGARPPPFFFLYFFFSLINHSSHCLFCRNLFWAVAVGFASRCYAQGGKKEPNFSANLLKPFSCNQRKLLTAFKRKNRAKLHCSLGVCAGCSWTERCNCSLLNSHKKVVCCETRNTTSKNNQIQ